MTIYYQKIDEKFIKKAVEYPPHMRSHHKMLRRRKVKVNVFQKVVKIDSSGGEYFNILIEENDDRRRSGSACIVGSTLKEIETKYELLNIRPTPHGISIHMRRGRWNECDHCGMWIWYDPPNGKNMWYDEVNSFYNKSLCTKCWNKLPLERRKEYAEAWNAFMATGKEDVTKTYVALEKKYGLKEK